MGVGAGAQGSPLRRHQRLRWKAPHSAGWLQTVPPTPTPARPPGADVTPSPRAHLHEHRILAPLRLLRAPSWGELATALWRRGGRERSRDTSLPSARRGCDTGRAAAGTGPGASVRSPSPLCLHAQPVSQAAAGRPRLPCGAYLTILGSGAERGAQPGILPKRTRAGRGRAAAGTAGKGPRSGGTRRKALLGGGSQG